MHVFLGDRREPTNDLCHETCRVYVYKDDSEIEVLARSSKYGAIGQIPFIVFHLARLIFTGQTSHLDIVYPRHCSFFKTF